MSGPNGECQCGHAVVDHKAIGGCSWCQCRNPEGAEPHLLDEQRRPSTEAGRHLHRLLLDMFKAWQMFEEVEPIEDPAGFIRSVEAEAGAERDRLEAALRATVDVFADGHGAINAGPYCYLTDEGHAVIERARAALGDG